MRTDIKTMDDIRLLVNTFYEQVRQDEVIGYFFDEVAGVDWDVHLPMMYSFWGSILLSQADYRGNPMIKHIMLSEKSRMEERHFEHWFALWASTVDALFEGEMAEEAKLRADNIRRLMFYKVERFQTGKSLI